MTRAPRHAPPPRPTWAPSAQDERDLSGIGWKFVRATPSARTGLARWTVEIARRDGLAAMAETASDPAVALASLIRYARAQ